MRKPLIGFLMACIAGFVLLAATAGEKCKHSESKCCEWMKDAKVDISNIKNGVIIKITSDKPDVVKLIQEHAPKCVTECKHNTGKCDHKEGSAECKKAHESEKCKHEESKCTHDNPSSCCKEKDSVECKKMCEPKKCKKP